MATYLFSAVYGFERVERNRPLLAARRQMRALDVDGARGSQGEWSRTSHASVEPMNEAIGRPDDGRPRAQAQGGASGVVGMIRTRVSCGQAAKGPMAAAPDASLPLDASVLSIVANLEGLDRNGWGASRLAETSGCGN